MEYAKNDPEDILVRITLHNRGTETARLHLLPSNSPYVKDAFHSYIISGKSDSVNPAKNGTKTAAHYILDVPGKSSQSIRMRLTASSPEVPFSKFEKIFRNRISDADEFYERITPKSLTEDERLVHRQALAGMLFSKQYYYFDLVVFDRSAQLPTGGSLEQADGTAWMAFYCQCMLEIALILTEYDPVYEEIAFKFVQNFMWISYAMNRIDEHHDEMWDEWFLH